MRHEDGKPFVLSNGKTYIGRTVYDDAGNVVRREHIEQGVSAPSRPSQSSAPSVEKSGVVEKYNTAMRGLVAGGNTRKQAAIILQRKEPELHAAFLEASQPDRSKHGVAVKNLTKLQDRMRAGG